jgi:YesN/AraC family two-component response regulator
VSSQVNLNAAFAGRIFKRKAKEQMRKDLNTLKSILENGG